RVHPGLLRAGQSTICAWLLSSAFLAEPLAGLANLERSSVRTSPHKPGDPSSCGDATLFSPSCTFREPGVSASDSSSVCRPPFPREQRDVHFGPSGRSCHSFFAALFADIYSPPDFLGTALLCSLSLQRDCFYDSRAGFLEGKGEGMARRLPGDDSVC